MSDVSQGPGWWLASDGKWYPPQPPAPPAAKPKKAIYKRVWFWILATLLLCMGGCTAVLVGGTAAVVSASHTKHSVVYSITGTGVASDVTYATLQQGTGQNGVAQQTNVTLPWSKTITASGLITAFSLSGTIGAGGGSLTCTITEDGKQLSTNTASGAFATAQCSASGNN